MKTAYLDAFSGLSGDMLVGALLDCGVDFEKLAGALASLPLKGARLSSRRKTVSGIAAMKFDVEVSEAQPERHLAQILAMIEASSIGAAAKRRARAIFEVLADSEAKVHHTTPEHVHFHEVGAVDSIMDVVGTAWALEELGVGELLVSPLPMGTGFARSQHGIIPVPAPATAELLAGFTVRMGDGPAEMVTPTGAAVLRALGRSAPIPLNFEIEKIGYGAGTREYQDRPNVLRIMVGRERGALDTDELLEISANIDDLNPQIYDHVMERLFAMGARDVTLTPTIMKKGRPAITIAVLAETAKRDALAKVLFAETSTIGVRFHAVARLKLRREIREVDTRWGRIKVKFSEGDGAMTATPEYDDCRKIATTHNVPLKTVMEETRAAAMASLDGHDHHAHHDHGHHH
jgi:pyridinium-3,5-bisthiocarboxylic acid mononucleotide nickel chelatase